MKTKYNPSVCELKKFAAQFTAFEWSTLCKSALFLETITTSIGRAAYHAAMILKRPVQFSYLRDSLSSELAARLLEDARRPSRLKHHHRKI